MSVTPALAGLLLMAACSTPTAPEWPAGAIPFDPPPAYAQWWKAVEGCSGRAGGFERVQWYVVEGSSFNGNQVGLWMRDGHRIALASWHVKTQRVVQHEMLHDLIGAPGHGPTFGECDVNL
ncbi:MAG: hypothetical protein ACREON_09230 [Gemmatimonadaceae bacterium]